MTVKWGIVGASGIAHRRMMPAINMAEGNELCAIMVRDMERAKKLAQEHGAQFYHDSVDAVISNPQVNAVYVATPVYLHCDHVVQAAEHGKHVLCEKPMAMNVDECRRMMDACRQNGVLLEICFLFRLYSACLEIKHILASGVLGEIIEARAAFLKWYPMEVGMWRRDPVRAGGGVLTDIGSHSIDLISYLLGDVSQVAAFTNSRTTKWEVEETATLLMRMQSGVHAIVDTSFAVPQSESMLEIYGTEGSILVDDDQGWKVKVFLKDGVKEDFKPYGNLYKPMLEHFSRCMDGDETPIAPGASGLKNVQIISAAYESAGSGEIIPISAE